MEQKQQQDNKTCATMNEGFCPPTKVGRSGDQLAVLADDLVVLLVHPLVEARCVLHPARAHMVWRDEGQLVKLGPSQLAGGQESVIAVGGVQPVDLVLLAHHAHHSDVVVCRIR